MIDPFADDLELEIVVYQCIQCKRQELVEFYRYPRAPEGWEPVWRPVRNMPFHFVVRWRCGRVACVEREYAIRKGA